MSGTTSGTYCQQWTTIRGATCICDDVFGQTVALSNISTFLHGAVKGVSSFEFASSADGTIFTMPHQQSHEDGYMLCVLQRISLVL